MRLIRNANVHKTVKIDKDQIAYLYKDNNNIDFDSVNSKFKGAEKICTFFDFFCFSI